MNSYKIYDKGHLNACLFLSQKKKKKMHVYLRVYDHNIKFCKYFLRGIHG